MIFKRGQKSKIDALTPATKLDVCVRYSNPVGSSLDISCFGLDASGKLSDDRYFVFYNQTASPCGSIRMNDGTAGYDKSFTVDLSSMPASINKMSFTITIDGAATMSMVPEGEIALMANGSKVMSYAFAGSEFGQEKALIMGEVYNKGGWRIAAVGQGFNGGLDALLKHFGGEVLEEKAPAPAPAAPAPVAPAPEPVRVSLGKVTLEKRGQSQKVSLSKGGGAQDMIHINLNWDEGKKSWFGGGEDVDLDLGCMFEMTNGDKGCIQPLGGYFGDQWDSPYIKLDKDDRSGSAADGENMRIYRPELIKRVLIFAMIYEGATNFTTVNGRVTVKDQLGSEILVRCDAPAPQRTFCAVCMITRAEGGISITKEERYFKHAEECDGHYYFGFSWRAGSK